MSIPTYSLFIVAPLNVLFNYLFVSPFPSFVQYQIADYKVWGPKSIRLGFSGGALATSISYTLNVRLSASQPDAKLISVCILLHMGNDVRTQRSSIPIQAISRILQTRHSHLPRSSWHHHGLVRMVGLGSLCTCRLNAWARLARCSIVFAFDY
jgi:hypothetical protein